MLPPGLLTDPHSSAMNCLAKPLAANDSQMFVWNIYDVKVLLLND